MYKTLTNRLKNILDQVIPSNQSVFIAGRLVTDNIMVAYEAQHYKIRKKARCGNMALKLDISKAYDRVKWDFRMKIMEKLGFGQR